jgi:hypothetical protein
MHILLFIVYSLLCCYGICKIPFFRRSGIRPTWLLLLFALHVLSGCIHNMIAWHFYPGHGDIWSVFERSFLTRHRLFSEFNLFLFENSKWTYFSHNSIIFLQVILNFFSFDNLYINTLLFSFPVFLANIAFYRLFRRRFPADPLTAVIVFLLPSTLFWTSCVHREGALYMLLGFLFYRLDQLFDRGAPALRRPNLRTAFYAFFCFLLIAYFRSAVALTLIPAFLAWWLAERPLHRRQFRALAAAIIVTILVLAVPGLSLLTSQQQSFLVLEGHSRLPLPALDGTWSSLWQVLPQAIRNGLFEPLPGSGGQRVYLVFSVETIFIWAIIVIALIRRFSIRNRPSPPPGQASPSPAPSFPPPLTKLAPTIPTTPALPFSPFAFPVCCVIFALTGMLLIGTLVPFAGAIIRYRSIYLPFLLAPFLHSLRHLPLFERLNARLARILPEPESGLTQTLNRL